MSIDERLRQGLRAEVAPASHPDLDVKAGKAIERGYRRRTIRRTGAVIAAVVVVAGIAIASPTLVRSLDGTQPAGSPTTPTVRDRAPSPLVGTFRLTVPPGAPGAAEVGAVGDWVLVIDAARRTSLTRVGDPRVTSTAFVAPQTIVLRVLGCGSGAGRYAWGLFGHTIRFTVTDDPCPLRSYLLHGPGRGHAWRVVTGT